MRGGHQGHNWGCGGIASVPTPHWLGGGFPNPPDRGGGSPDPLGGEVSPQTPVVIQDPSSALLVEEEPSQPPLGGGDPPQTPRFWETPPPSPPFCCPSPHSSLPGVLAFFFFTHRIKLVEDAAPTLNYYWVPILVSGAGGDGG